MFSFEQGEKLFEARERKEKIMATTKKTKEQLLQEIEVLQGKVDKLERFEKYADTADEMGAMVEAFENSGFSREEAIRMVLGLLPLAAQFVNPRLF